MPSFQQSLAVRVATAMAYAVVAAWVAGGILVSTYRSASEAMGERPVQVVSGAPGDYRRCLQGLQALYKELDGRLRSVYVGPSSGSPSRDWDSWSPGWRQKLNEVAARCHLEQGQSTREGKLLKEAVSRLAQLHGSYSVNVLQFSREIGPTASATRAAFEAAQQALERP